MLLKTSMYVKCYNGQTKWTYFFIENNDLLEKHDTVCDTEMVESVAQIKSGIMISVGVSVKFLKNIMHVKKAILGILLCVVVKMVNM